MSLFLFNILYLIVCPWFFLSLRAMWWCLRRDAARRKRFRGCVTECPLTISLYSSPVTWLHSWALLCRCTPRQIFLPLISVVFPILVKLHPNSYFRQSRLLWIQAHLLNECSVCKLAPSLCVSLRNRGLWHAGPRQIQLARVPTNREGGRDKPGWISASNSCRAFFLWHHCLPVRIRRIRGFLLSANMHNSSYWFKPQYFIQAEFSWHHHQDVCPCVCACVSVCICVMITEESLLCKTVQLLWATGQVTFVFVCVLHGH